MMSVRPFYHRESYGVRVTVRPSYLAHQSHPARGHFVFAYFVRIENVGGQTVQLKSRFWQIHDSGGEDMEVEGDGVVGEQPVIPPGRVYEYQSFCVLRSAAGYMEGRYNFARADGTMFAAEIPRFLLDAETVRGTD